jgi:hypothetical protein
LGKSWLNLVISRNLPEKSPFFKIRPMENPLEITMDIHHENLVKSLVFFVFSPEMAIKTPTMKNSELGLGRARRRRA